MDHLQIPMEGNDENWRQRCNDRMGRLKGKEFHNPDPPSLVAPLQEDLFAEKNSLMLKLPNAVQNGDVDNFVDVLEQLSSESNLPLSSICDQVTRAGDSLLHEAAYFGREKIAELIAHHFPELLTKRNVKGDTPLHVAARAKNSYVIKVILSQYAPCLVKNEPATRLTNEYGNTALHEAVYSKHLDGVTLLFRADKCVAHYLNKSGRSPLYLAVLTTDKEIVDLLLQEPFPNDKSLPNCHGNSPLHAVIYTQNAALLKEILEKKSDLMYLRDEDGGTPLHYAATFDYLESVRIMLNKSALTALEWNAKGHLPIHLACKWGHVQVVKELLQQEWPHPRILLNKKGQNILHVAAKNGRHNVVKYLLRNTKLKQLILNEQDKDGNTPLHLASKNFFPTILFSLTRDKSIHVNIKNNEGLPALDTLWLQSEQPMTRGQWLSHEILYNAGAPVSIKGLGIIRKRRVPPKLDWIKDRINTLMLVAILIVTVTFAAGFTVPGSVYSSDDPNPHNRGMAVLSKRRMFQIFVVFNTIAMYSSTFGSFVLLWAQLGDYHLARRSFDVALGMVGMALVTISFVFMAAVRLVVSNVSWLANVITLIGIICLISLILSIGIFFFSGETHMPLLRQVYDFFIWIAISLYGRPPKAARKLKKYASQGQVGMHMDENNKDE